MKVKKITVLFALIMGIGILTGCGGKASIEADEDTYAFLAKDVNNPYMSKIYEGFEETCKELGSKSVYVGPDIVDAGQQLEIAKELTQKGVKGIAVAADDEDALSPVLQEAMNAGIKVISLDSAVNADSRMVHIQQSDPEQIGRTLIQAAYEITGGDGGIAILSASATATNQNIWIEWMDKELSENPDKYKNMPLIKKTYCDDNPLKAVSQTQSLLQNPEIKVIIAPTTVGMLSAAQVIKDSGLDVKLTGLGLPSEMAEFIEEGICPQMYLWNPIDIGTLAGYTLDALASGDIKGSAGETFTAGELGEKMITTADDGGTEIILDAPFRFDSENILEWKNVY